MKCATPGKYKRKALIEHNEDKAHKQNETCTKNRENVHKILSTTAIINSLCSYSQKLHSL